VATVIPFLALDVEAVTAVISPCVSALIVTAPVAPLIVTLVPATILVTPVFVNVTAPVAPLTLMPVLATAEVTPVLFIVGTGPVGLVIDIAVPAVKPVRSPCGAAAIKFATVIDLFVVVLRSYIIAHHQLLQ
jgi:hypothetical protein